MSDDPFLPAEDGSEKMPSPWGFRILVAAVVIYLGYRAVQGVVALVRWIST